MRGQMAEVARGRPALHEPGDLQLAPLETMRWAHCLSELQIAGPLAEIFRAWHDDIEDMIQSRSAERTWREEREWAAAFSLGLILGGVSE